MALVFWTHQNGTLNLLCIPVVFFHLGHLADTEALGVSLAGQTQLGLGYHPPNIPRTQCLCQCSLSGWSIPLFYLCLRVKPFQICSSKISLACESHAAYHHWLYYIYIYISICILYICDVCIYIIYHKCVFSDGKRYVGICRNHEPTELHANLRPCDTQIEYSSHLWPNYVPKAGKSSIYEHL